ncbi:MAG: ankyrin repeat domain-containing protein [Chlamydiia bacterium]|nr:ankyrin repeat domain-containing protein [Chlamydiia bacterium]
METATEMGPMDGSLRLPAQAQPHEAPKGIDTVLVVIKDFLTTYFGYGIKGSSETNVIQAQRLKDIFKSDVPEQKMLNEALLVEAYAGHKNMVIRLLAKGADINATVREQTSGLQGGIVGLSVLHLAMLSEREDKKSKITEKVIRTSEQRNGRLLAVLNKGNPNENSRSLGGAIIAALAKGNDSIAEKFYAIANQDEKEKIAADAFSHFLMKGNIEALKWLHKKHPGLISTSINDNLPLVSAATGGSKELVEWLVQKGAEGAGKALHALVNRAVINDTAPKILALKSGINETDEYGNTPLQVAIQNGKPALALQLIENGAEVNPAEGLSPLQQAMTKSQLEVAKKLIEKGALVNPKGVNLIEFAIDSNQFDLIPLLKKDGVFIKGSNDEYLIHKAFKAGKIEAVKHLKSDINAPDEKGNTLLHVATSLEQVTQLINFGADLAIKNKEGETPLHVATRDADFRVMENLAARNETMSVHDLRNNAGQTPLEIAVLQGDAQKARSLARRSNDKTKMEAFTRATTRGLALAKQTIDPEAITDELVEEAANNKQVIQELVKVMDQEVVQVAYLAIAGQNKESVFVEWLGQQIKPKQQKKKP